MRVQFVLGAVPAKYITTETAVVLSDVSLTTRQSVKYPAPDHVEIRSATKAIRSIIVRYPFVWLKISTRDD